MKKYIVYETTNLINGKYYIGVHKVKGNNLYFGSGSLLIKALNKYGRDNFIRETLKEFNNENDAYEFEKNIITEELVENKNCYNICGGGYGAGSGKSNPMYGTIVSEKRKKNISEGNKRAYKEGKNKISKKGLKRKIESLKGNKYAKGNRHKLSDETKKKMSEVRKGYKMKKESIEKLKKSKQVYRYFIKGNQYISSRDASKNTGIDRGTIIYRIKSPNFPDYNREPIN